MDGNFAINWRKHSNFAERAFNFPFFHVFLFFLIIILRYRGNFVFTILFDTVNINSTRINYYFFCLLSEVDKIKMNDEFLYVKFGLYLLFICDIIGLI